MALSDYFSKSKTRELTEQEEFERVRREVANLNTRLSAVGEQPKKSPTSSPLLTILESLVRPGYGIMNAAREFSNPDYGATPGVRDIPQAFARGFRLEERSTGKDILTDLGVSDEPFADFNVGKVNLKPNLAGLLGFGLDVLNPLDPLNWVTLGVGKAGIKGAQQLVKGRKLLEASFGKDVTEELIEKLGEDWVSRVSEDTVGSLVKKLSDRADKLGIQEGINAHAVSELMRKGIETQGLKADSRVRPRLQNAIKLSLQAPIVNKSVAQFDLPGSRPLLNVLSALGEKTSKSPVGQAMGQAFSTRFTPSTVPASVWTRFIRQGARIKDESPDKLSELIDNLRAGDPSTAPTTNLGTKALDGLETTSGEEAYKELKSGLYRMMEKARIQEQQFERGVADVFEGLNAKERKEVMKGVLYPDYKISDKLAPAVNAFKQWRQQVVDEYKSLGVTFTPIEEYVPFVVSGKPLSKDEAALLKGIFGTGVRQLQQGDIVDLLAKVDPHLIERSTDVIDPAKINKILGREWLTEDAAVAMARRGVRAVRGEEASIFLHGMMEKWGLTVEDITQLQHLPDGYVMVKPRVESTGRINLDATKVEKGEKAFALPQEFVKAYNEYTDLMFNPEARTKLGQFFDQATRAYKTMAYMWNPGHIPRDLMSNLYNLWLMDVRSPAPYFKAAQIMRHAMKKNVDEVPLKIGEWEGTMKQFYNMVEQLGVIDSGAVLAEFMQAGSDWSFRMGGKYTDVMRKMTRVNDNWARMAGMIDRISKGYSPEEAAGQVKKYLFDYFELTPFEKRVMKRVVPFYTWIRKNLPLQVEMLFSKPGKYATTYKAMEGIGDIPEEGEVPDFIRDAGGVLLPGEEKGSYVIPNLSYADLGKVPLSLEQLREYMAMVNPIFRAPVEMMSNVSLFSGQPLENYRGEYRNIPFGELLKSLGAVEEPPKIPTRTLGYLLDQIPPLRTLSTISNPEHPRQMARLISFLGGPQIYPEDWAIEAASYETRDELRSLIRSLQDRGTYVPTIDELTPNKTKKKKGKITSLSDIF